MRHLLYTKTSLLSSSPSPLSCLRRPNHLHLLLFSRGSHSLPRGQQEEEESRKVRVSVWWDFENCGVPSGVNVYRVAAAITAAVRAAGIKGPVEITAFGDMLRLSRFKQEGLSSTGINLTHIPRGGKNSTDRSLLISLMYWVSQNPPPAHLFLISGDRDFASTLHRLRMNNYNILLATPESAHGVLCSSASIMWNWQDLLRGESLSGKYFNQPPDSPYSSWYGHHKVPLLDPFVTDVEKSCVQSEELSETNLDEKPYRLVPKAVVKQIRRIVESNPKGIAIKELRNELVSNVSFDREYYGYKKFLPFLLSLENVVKLKRGKDKHYVVYSMAHNCVDCEDENESFERTSVDDGSKDAQNKFRLNENTIRMSNGSDKKIVETLGDDVIESVFREEKVLEIYNEPKLEKQTVERVDGSESDNNFPAVVRQESSSEDGFFRRFWTKWFGSESSSSDNKGCKGEVKSMGKYLEKDSNPSTYSSLFSWPAVETKSSEAFSEDKPVMNPGFLNQIQNWFKSTSDSNKETLIICDLGHELFSKDSFWRNMESFMDSSLGSLLVSESKTREQMAHEFRRNGPECLQSLGENDLRHLVDLLISEKKWVEELSSQVFPFRLTMVAKSTPSKTHPSATLNSLSSLFKSQSSQSGTKRLLDLDEQGRSKEKSQVRSKDKVLADCQNLVSEILKEHPNGYFTGLFRKQFFDRYGYQLDFQKLGYRHLAGLLSTFPGAKIKSCYIVPCNKALSEGENFSHGTTALDSSLSYAPKKSHDLNYLWEELGRISSSKSRRSDEEVTDLDYEPAISEDEFSDSDKMGHINIMKKKPEFKNENINNNCSLLRILDSWHCRDDGDLSTNKSENEEMTSRTTRMQDWNRTKKSYSFVFDSGSDEDDADKFANGSLRDLRAPNESSKNEKYKVLCVRS